MASVPQAVIVGAQVNGLGVVRSLAREDIPAIVVDTTLRHPAMWSRSARSLLVDQLAGRAFVDSLLKLQSELGTRPVLILTDETAVATVSQYRDELSAAYRFHLPAEDVLTTLENKARFHEFAAQYDLPVPATIIFSTEADFEKLARLRYPLIVKPADKRPVHLGRTRRLAYLGTKEEALAICAEMVATAGELVVQEWIDGPDSEIYFSLFHHGKDPQTTAIFYGRKVASYPPRVGSTAICVAAPEAESALAPLTKRFLEVARYEGLGGLEFKWDAKAKRFIIIEPTVGRTDWQEEIATLNGVNLPAAAYHYELGLPPASQQPIDRPAVWREAFRHGGGSSAPALSGARIYDGYWRSNDPVPALVYYSNFILRNTLRRIAPSSLRPNAPILHRSKGTA